jgi:hypothetical protein
MAQPITCDYTGCGLPYDVLVSRAANGETLAWCDPHYIEVARAIVDAVDALEREATDAAALAQLGEVGPGPTDGASAEPVQGPIQGVGMMQAPGFPTSGDSSPAATPPAEPPTEPASGPRRPEPHSGATRGRKARPEPPPAALDDPDEAGTVPR